MDRVLGVFRRTRTEPPAPEHGLIDAAHAVGIDGLRINDPNASRARTRIATAQADLFVVAGFPYLLPPALLSLPSRGGLNIHPGRLPQERGPAPLYWALKAGRTQIGFALHVLDRGEDTGDLLASGEVNYTPGLDGQAILALCAEAAAPHLLRSVRGMLSGDVVRTKQPRVGATRRPRPAFRDGLIDPSLPAEAVFTFVAGCARAYSLFAECGGDRFFISHAHSYDPEADLAFEYVLSGDRLMLRCSPGVVELELRPQGALFSAEYQEQTQ